MSFNFTAAGGLRVSKRGSHTQTYLVDLLTSKSPFPVHHKSGLKLGLDLSVALKVPASHKRKRVASSRSCIQLAVGAPENICILLIHAANVGACLRIGHC